MTKVPPKNEASEEKLRQERAFFRQVIDLNPNFIFAKDREGRFTLVNQAIADAYGTTVDKLIGKTDADFNPNKEEVEHFRRFDLKVMDSQKETLIPEEVITDAKGNLRWLQTVKRPIIGDDGVANQVLGVATDITARKKAEEHLIEVQEELQHSQKMEALGSLAGGIAHDFNNLLTGILGFADVLKRYSTEPDEVIHTAGLIAQAAERAQDLTSQLLGFARRGKHLNIPVNVHSAIDEAIGLLERTLEKNIIVEKQFEAAQFHVRGDPVQIQQVLLNLAINARDALSEKTEGQLLFSTQQMQILAGDVNKYGIAEPGEYLKISVSDNGCGMEAAIQKRIYEPFFTTKELGKGTGMGLAMVYGIIHNHSGAISFQSEPGKGSTFDIILPLSSSEELKETVRSELGIMKGEGTILLVDDESIVREVGSAMLKKLGYQVIVACDGGEAVDIYRIQSASIDLVIVDMIMPGLSGKECYLELRKLNPKIRAILSTGYGLNLKAQEVLNEGLQGFIQKPYRLAELSTVVAEVMAG